MSIGNVGMSARNRDERTIESNGSARHSRNKLEAWDTGSQLNSKKTMEGKMSKKAAEHHIKAAEQADRAAKQHREAARLHEAGDPKAAAHHAHMAQGHLNNATRHADDAAELYIIETI
jgi:hypothetical protein